MQARTGGHEVEVGQNHTLLFSASVKSQVGNFLMLTTATCSNRSGDLKVSSMCELDETQLPDLDISSRRRFLTSLVSVIANWPLSGF